MQKLHLVGFTAGLDGLILSVRKGSSSGGFVVDLDDALVQLVGDAERVRSGAMVVQPSKEARSRASRHGSALNPRELQDRLRAGWTVEEVAAEAGTDAEWVNRFAAPVKAEQARIIATARGMTFDKPRLGPSSVPLGPSVRRNLAERGQQPPDDDADAGWGAFQLDEGLWVVRFAYTSRGRAQQAEWLVDLAEEQLVARDRLASQLGHVGRGRTRVLALNKAAPRKRKAPPRKRSAPFDPASATAVAARAKKTPAKKAAPAKRAPAKRAPAKQAAPAKKVPAKKAAPAKKVPAKKAAPAKRVPAKKAAPAKKVPAKKAAPAKKVPAKKVPAKKAPAKKAPAKRVAPAPVKRAGFASVAPPRTTAPPVASAPAPRPALAVPTEQRTPVADVPSPEAPPVEQAPVEQAPVEQAPVEQAPVEQPVEQLPVEQPPVAQPPVEQVPAEEAADVAVDTAWAAPAPQDDPVPSADSQPSADRERPSGQDRIFRARRAARAAPPKPSSPAPVGPLPPPAPIPVPERVREAVAEPIGAPTDTGPASPAMSAEADGPADAGSVRGGEPVPAGPVFRRDLIRSAGGRATAPRSGERRIRADEGQPASRDEPEPAVPEPGGRSAEGDVSSAMDTLAALYPPPDSGSQATEKSRRRRLRRG